MNNRVLPTYQNNKERNKVHLEREPELPKKDELVQIEQSNLPIGKKVEPQYPSRDKLEKSLLDRNHPVDPVLERDENLRPPVDKLLPDPKEPEPPELIGKDR